MVTKECEREKIKVKTGKTACALRKPKKKLTKTDEDDSSSLSG